MAIESRVFYGFFWAMYNALIWSCNVDFNAPCHPVLDAWCTTWNGLLDLPKGREAKECPRGRDAEGPGDHCPQIPLRDYPVSSWPQIAIEAQRASEECASKSAESGFLACRRASMAEKPGPEPDSDATAAVA